MSLISESLKKAQQIKDKKKEIQDDEDHKRVSIPTSIVKSVISKKRPSNQNHWTAFTIVCMFSILCIFLIISNTYLIKEFPLFSKHKSHDIAFSIKSADTQESKPNMVKKSEVPFGKRTLSDENTEKLIHLKEIDVGKNPSEKGLTEEQPPINNENIENNLKSVALPEEDIYKTFTKKEDKEEIPQAQETLKQIKLASIEKDINRIEEEITFLLDRQKEIIEEFAKNNTNVDSLNERGKDNGIDTSSDPRNILPDNKMYNVSNPTPNWQYSRDNNTLRDKTAIQISHLITDKGEKIENKKNRRVQIYDTMKKDKEEDDLNDYLQKQKPYIKWEYLQNAKKTKKGIKNSKMSSSNHNNLGLDYYIKGDYENALEHLKTAILIDPNDYESYMNLGIVLKKQENFNYALKAYKKAILLSPDAPEPYYNLGILFEEMGLLNNAAIAYKNFLQYAPQKYEKLRVKVQKRIEEITSKIQ